MKQLLNEMEKLFKCNDVVVILNLMEPDAMTTIRNIDDLNYYIENDGLEDELSCPDIVLLKFELEPQFELFETYLNKFIEMSREYNNLLDSILFTKTGKAFSKAESIVIKEKERFYKRSIDKLSKEIHKLIDLHKFKL